MSSLTPTLLSYRLIQYIKEVVDLKEIAPSQWNLQIIFWWLFKDFHARRHSDHTLHTSRDATRSRFLKIAGKVFQEISRILCKNVTRALGAVNGLLNDNMTTWVQQVCEYPTRLEGGSGGFPWFPFQMRIRLLVYLLGIVYSFELFFQKEKSFNKIKSSCKNPTSWWQPVFHNELWEIEVSQEFVLKLMEKVWSTKFLLTEDPSRLGMKTFSWSFIAGPSLFSRSYIYFHSFLPQKHL